MPNFPALVSQFANDCEEKFANLHGAQPEDQLKPLVGDLLAAFGPFANANIAWRSEVREDDVDGRPDIGVIVADLLTGHIELKAPGVGARPEQFKGNNKRQFDRFRALPNLIYTDGSEWSLYRSGELAARVAIADDIRDGAKALASDALGEFRTLLADFTNWAPKVPGDPGRIAEFIAPLARILRDEVESALGRGNKSLRALATEWRGILFPEADDAQFADAYAQTLTYALLLAQFEGAESLDPFGAIPKLQGEHALLASALQLLEAAGVRDELLMPISLLERVIGAIEPSALETSQDHWLYFYEDFLAAYDPALRKDRGVYFTPIEVVECQVRFAAELLRTRFGKPLGFAEESVQILDPAVGTGTYPLAIIDHAAATVAERYGPGAVPQQMDNLAKRLEAFELLVGPYAVARLRITQRLRDAGATGQSARVYLADTLASPTTLEEFPTSLLSQPMTDDRKAAQTLKNDRSITVCIGNPPYDRGKKGEAETGKEGPGGWVVHGDIELDQPPILRDFTKPVIEAGGGGHLKNIYNSYVYFWRWALWKVFESPDYQGIVTFITASSYLRGPGFAGMREVMRKTFDELWIIDLEGDNLGARKTDNVFAIQSPVAIAIGVRSGGSDAERPAVIRKAKLTGTAKDKLAQLDAANTLSDLDWQTCSDAWDDPFYPIGAGAYFDWPDVRDVFPWQQSGVKVGRTWPIAESVATLKNRWLTLVGSEKDQRGALFVKRPNGRMISDRPVSLTNPGIKHNSIEDAVEDEGITAPVRYALRFLDRQYVISDSRLIERPAPRLWNAHGEHQVYMTSLLTSVVGTGPAAVAASNIPDLHHFRGSFGAKHVIPLYRDSTANDPNITDGILDLLNTSAESLFAYAYGILAQPAYVEYFWDELELPPPHLTLTKNSKLFNRVAEHGRRLIYLHTYGERFGGPQDDGSVPPGRARCEVPVSQSEYPNTFGYNEQTQTLSVGEGEFRPVPREVYEYSVSGLRVVQSWLGYRMRDRKGRKSSPLDDIRPERWEFTEELLELLWVLEQTIDLEPAGRALLDEVLESDLWTAAELPKPTDAERKPPKPKPAAAGTLGL